MKPYPPLGSRLPAWGTEQLEAKLFHEFGIDQEIIYVWFHSHPIEADAWFLVPFEYNLVANELHRSDMNFPREILKAKWGLFTISIMPSEKFFKKELLDSWMRVQSHWHVVPATFVKINMLENTREELTLTLTLCEYFQESDKIYVKFAYQNKRDFLITKISKEVEV